MFGYGRVIIPLIVLLVVFFVLYIILRRRKIKKKEEQLEKLKEDFSDSRAERVEVGDEGKETLKEVANQIRKAFREGKDAVNLTVGEDVAINIETPDVISLEFPEYTLYKSFGSARFKRRETTEEGFKLYFARE